MNSEIIPEIHRQGINAHQNYHTYTLMLRTPGVGVEVIGTFLNYEAAKNAAFRMGFSINQICRNF